MRRFDAIVVGAGHNGLVAACYLARAGRRVMVVERRDVVGGAAVTEELLPGYRISTASYSLSLLRPDVYHDLELARHGLSFSPKDPQMFVPLPDGRHFFVWRDGARTRDELARISQRDAGAHARWGAFWDEAVRLLRPMIESDDPPSLAEVEKSVPEEIWRLAVAGSAAETVEAFFDAEAIRGAFAGQGIIGTRAGVRDPGTAWVMTYHALGGELLGMDGTWAYARGGMGAVTQALAASAREHGVEIHTGSPVDEILVERGRATGVRLAGGEELRASAVLSNADPKRTFQTLLPAGSLDESFRERVREWPVPGSVIKVNLALGELPDFVALPGTRPGPQHFGTVEISPSIDALQRAFEEARGAAPSSRPFMEVFIQSATDSTLAPPGHHVLSAFTQYAPADLRDWPRARATARDNVIGTLASYAPNLPGAILAEDVLGPPELEERLALTGGNIFHGEILPERCFGERFSYRTPVRGLYLCGSGAAPGGGVMGAAGRNAARAVLADT